MVSLQELLLDATESPPCGRDLTYDADFLAMEAAARGKPEQQFGSTLIAAEAPDWREVERCARLLHTRTKDLRIAVLLCHAWTAQLGLPGLASGLQLITELQQRYGESLHPLPEDGDDFMRSNALALLDDVTGLVRTLRDTAFLRSPLGQLSVREAEAVIRGTPVGDAGQRMSIHQLRAAVAEELRNNDAVLLAVTPLQQSLTQLHSVFQHQGAAQQGARLTQLQVIINTLAEALPQAPAQEQAGQARVAARSAPAEETPSPQAPGLHTREQAIAQLLQVAEFLELTEPANPASLLIRRAARLMRMGFMDILRDLAPDSLPQVETITGAKPQA